MAHVANIGKVYNYRDLLCIVINQLVTKLPLEVVMEFSLNLSPVK